MITCSRGIRWDCSYTESEGVVQVANIFFLEAPRDVGFSYRANDGDETTVNDYNDDLVSTEI